MRKTAPHHDQEYPERGEKETRVAPAQEPGANGNADCDAGEERHHPAPRDLVPRAPHDIELCRKVDEQQEHHRVAKFGQEEGQKADRDETGPESEKDIHGLGDRQYHAHQEKQGHRGKDGFETGHRVAVYPLREWLGANGGSGPQKQISMRWFSNGSRWRRV